MTLSPTYMLHATLKNFVQCAKQSVKRSGGYGLALRQVNGQNFMCPVRVAPKTASYVVRKLKNSVAIFIAFFLVLLPFSAATHQHIGGR